MPKQKIKAVVVYPESNFPMELRVVADRTAEEEETVLYACTLSLDETTKELRVQRKVKKQGPETGGDEPPAGD